MRSRRSRVADARGYAQRLLHPTLLRARGHDAETQSGLGPSWTRHHACDVLPARLACRDASARVAFARHARLAALLSRRAGGSQGTDLPHAQVPDAATRSRGEVRAV